MIETYIETIMGVLIPLVQTLLSFIKSLSPEFFYEILLGLSVLIAYTVHKSTKVFINLSIGFYALFGSLIFIIFILIMKIIEGGV